MSAAPGSIMGPARLFHFVDGAPVTSAPGRVHLVEGLAYMGGAPVVPIAFATDVDELLDHCSAGLARWLAIGPAARRRILTEVAETLSVFTFDLAEAVADDLDVPCETSVALVTDVFAKMRLAASWPASTRLPVGIHAVLVGHRSSPLILAETVWPMLLAGSIAVIRPAPDFARASAVLASALSAAGLPDGVVNVIHGDAGTSSALIDHPAIAGVIAVGSSAHLGFVARSASRRATPTLLFGVS